MFRPQQPELKNFDTCKQLIIAICILYNVFNALNMYSLLLLQTLESESILLHQSSTETVCYDRWT